ncbi:MAG: 16S rRNA (guanine(966)-N(2))-methyltransferase RsmD [Oscillospiraceae bacterium]|nr:16S rRNA (guanine(966)-N(2))-methyltransferase RsmD [Oscillospiraceae bacterium]
MRIISGTARGRKLKEPDGLKIRPTTDRVKEALFNVIQFDIPGRRVLDLFAGSGQLGIECLSRGAISCDFVDTSLAAVQLVRENLKRTELPDGEVYQNDAISFLQRGGQYDLVLLDPPYDLKQLDDILRKIVQIDILNKNGIIVCETNTDRVLPQLEPPYGLTREYRYGKVKLSLFTRKAD